MDKVRQMLRHGAAPEGKVVHDAGEGNSGSSAGAGSTSGVPLEGGIRRDDEIRMVDEHNSHHAGGSHEGLAFGEKWDPSAEIAANVRRSQIIALASSRAEKGAQDELLPDRRSSIAKLDEERRFSASRDPESHDDRIRALAHSRSEAGHHQNELLPHSHSSIAKTERERSHAAAIPKDDIEGRIRALAASRSEKGSHQTELLPDRRSSIQLAEDNRKHSLAFPAESPRKSSVTPFVNEAARQEARKESIAGLYGVDPAESLRRSSVAAGLAAYAAGTGQQAIRTG